MDIRVLGPLEVERDGQTLGLGGVKQRSVLAMLALHAGEVVSTDRLIDAVWDGEPPPSVQSTLRGYVSKLRKALDPGRDLNAPHRILRTAPTGYLLDVADEQIDARRFERLVRRGRDRDDAAGAVEDWTQALALWRGEAFQDVAYRDFAQAEARRLTELRFTCLEDLFDARLRSGDHDTVVGDLDAFCAAKPERERALRLRMLALYRCGRQTEALEAYEEGRRRLAAELGVDPSPEVRDLHEQILRHDASLTVVDGSPTSGKGTLTFLLGDVERSTERLRALGDDYARVLSEHRRVVRGACESHGSRAIRTYRGGTLAAFECATDAIAAAVAAQRALCGWELPVRMGLNTGETAFASGEYVGLAIHVAARVMDAAHGGQVLVSQATRELFEVEEGADVELLDTGTHTLEDVPGEVRLFQVVHPDLRRGFPPLRTRSGRTDNLPNRLTSFVGRERDVEEVEETLAEARVVTLTGVGGVGKTRLAVEVGRRVVLRYADGVWLCGLAPIGDADALVHSVATTLGVDQQPGRSMRESLLAAVGQRESLLILDNCEHLLAPVAELVEDIVRVSGSTDVLSTSREAMGVEGERSWPVHSLSPAVEAVRLFEDRARAVRPEFCLDERNASAVAEICTKLDGIPLAVELAAARVTSMSPAQIAARLEEGFHFLRSGRRAAVDRHRTLHGAITWSYDLLSEAERLLFDRLSVFAGGFTLEAVEEVCGRDLDLDVADGLASLVAKSMLDADVGGREARYSLLETMRQYAQDRLAERDDADDVLRSHATYFARMREELADDHLHGDSEGTWHATLVEFDNLRAAQAWARSSGEVDLAIRIVGTDLLGLPSQFPEVSAWAEDIIAMPEAEDHPLLSQILIHGLGDALPAGDLARARQLIIRALDVADDQDDATRGMYLCYLGWLSALEGRLDEAGRLNAQALRLVRASGRPGIEALVLSVVSITESNSGHLAIAVEMVETACALADRASSAVQGIARYFLGEALLAAGEDLERAMDSLERSIVLCRANGLDFWVGAALVALASLRARHGDPLEALRMFHEVVDRWRLAGEWIREWVTLRNLAELFGRLHLDVPAAVLVAASQGSATAPPSAGLQGERIAKLRGELAERMGAKAFTAACERGRMMSDGEAVAYATAEIDRAVATCAGL